MYYAAYGSNLHPLRLRERVASARLIGTHFLADWSLRFHKRSRDKSAKCNIDAGGSGIYVAVSDISVADMRTLDGIEGLGSGYSEAIDAVSAREDPDRDRQAIRWQTVKLVST